MGIFVYCRCWIKTDSLGLLSVAIIGGSRAQRIIVCCHLRGKPVSSSVAAVGGSWAPGGHCMLPLFGKVELVGIVVCCRCWGKTDLWESLNGAAAKESPDCSLFPPSGEAKLMGVVVCCCCSRRTRGGCCMSPPSGEGEPKGSLSVAIVGGELGSWDSLCFSNTRRSWDYGDCCLLPPSKGSRHFSIILPGKVWLVGGSSFIAAAAPLYIMHIYSMI